ncbi:MAG: transmembrane anchor protein [Polaromonas sp.]|nr:transmembrane anchor protein [Polaromonas sp.]
MYNTDLPTRAELPTSRQLVRSTVIAAAVAGALLVAVVLPSEYGIDPTGIGRVTGLAEMGAIKVSLASEAAAETPASAPGAATASTVTAPAAAALAPAAAATPAPSAPAVVAKPVVSGQSQQMTVTLKPGQGAEVKLDMRKGAKVAYRWETRGGTVNYDAHGDPVQAPAGFYHGYGKGREVNSDEGTLEAAFDGKHGWFWRNRSKAEVTVTLKADGEYTAIKRVL